MRLFLLIAFVTCVVLDVAAYLVASKAGRFAAGAGFAAILVFTLLGVLFLALLLGTFL